MLKIVLWEYN